MDDPGMQSEELEPTEGQGPSDGDLSEDMGLDGEDASALGDEAAAGPESTEEPVVDPEAEPEASFADEPAPQAADEPAPAPQTETPAAEPAEEHLPATLDEMVASLTADTAEREAADAEPALVADEVAQEAESTREAESTPAAADEETAPAEAEAQTPGVAEAPESGPAVPKPLSQRLWTRLPFWIEFGAFVAGAGGLAYLLWPASREALTTLPAYAALVLGGASLILVIFVTGLVVWLSARGRATDDERVGLARTVWTRALCWAAAAAAVWWVALLVLDMHRIGALG